MFPYRLDQFFNRAYDDMPIVDWLKQSSTSPISEGAIRVLVAHKNTLTLPEILALMGNHRAYELVVWARRCARRNVVWFPTSGPGINMTLTYARELGITDKIADLLVEQALDGDEHE